MNAKLSALSPLLQGVFDSYDSRTLYISVQCSDYVTRFSVIKMASAQNTLCESVQKSDITPSTSDIVKLIEIA